MEAQRLSFQIELERVRGELDLFEQKLKSLEDEIRFLKSPGKHPAPRLRPAKRNSTTSSNEQEEREWRQSEERERSQPIETHEVDVNPPKQGQSGTVRKIYAQVAKDNPTRSSSENPWAEVKYDNKKQGAAKKGNQRQGPRGKGDLISQGKSANKKVREGYHATQLLTTEGGGNQHQSDLVGLDTHNRGLFQLYCAKCPFRKKKKNFETDNFFLNRLIANSRLSLTFIHHLPRPYRC